jgi:hypothetical protein
MDENNINSYHDAESFMMTKFGEPDYFTKSEDITQVEEYLNPFREELESLERYVKNVSDENVNHFKLNRSISLHYLLRAGTDYIELLQDVVYDKEIKAIDDDEVVEEIFYEKEDMFDGDSDGTKFGTSDFWDRP